MPVAEISQFPPKSSLQPLRNLSNLANEIGKKGFFTEKKFGNHSFFK
jgi:hypothetical protein